jgi:hypothetical protein
MINFDDYWEVLDLNESRFKMMLDVTIKKDTDINDMLYHIVEATYYTLRIRI